MFSCKKEKSSDNIKIINIDPDLKSSYTKSVFEIDTIIHLQTSDKSLIGDISEVKFYADRYYILDKEYSRTVFVFDKKGMFINKTIIGRGPKEIISPAGFKIEKKKNQIVVWDDLLSEEVIFDLNLNYIKRRKFKAVIAKSYVNINDTLKLAFVRDGDPKLFFASKKIQESSNYFIFSDDFSIIYKKLFPLPNELNNLDVTIPISKFEDKILFVCLYDYNIYRLEKLEPVVLYRIDFGKYCLTKNEIKKGFEYIWASFHRNEKIITIENLFENKVNLSFSYFYKGRMNFCIYSKETNKTYVSNFKKGSIFSRINISGTYLDDRFIGVVNPNDLKAYYLKNNYSIALQPIREKDNQSLVIFKLNE